MRSVGGRLHERRLELGLTQREAQTEHVSYAYISRLEAGTRRASISALIELGERLHCTALWLLTGNDRGYCPVCQRGGSSSRSNRADRAA